MPHIHTEPNQHDMTVSAYIVRLDTPEPLCLVHMHRKIGKLMQIGGHIELNETPWQSIAHELEEESGYTLPELQVVQHTAERVVETDNVGHPTPFSMNTHSVGNNHYHSDLCFGFVAHAAATKAMAEGESEDLRWLSLLQLDQAFKAGESVQDVYNIYTFLLSQLGSYALIDANDFSLGKPTTAAVTYLYGAPGEKA